MNCRFIETKTNISNLIKKYGEIKHCETYTEIYKTKNVTISETYNCCFNIVLFFKKGKVKEIKKRIPIDDRWKNGKLNLCPYDDNKYPEPDLKKISKKIRDYEKRVDDIIGELQKNISIQHKKIEIEEEIEKRNIRQ